MEVTFVWVNLGVTIYHLGQVEAHFIWSKNNQTAFTKENKNLRELYVTLVVINYQNKYYCAFFCVKQ